MPVRLNGATELTNRPSWRDFPSFSPPTVCMSEISLEVALVGMPSRNIRTVNGSGLVPSMGMAGADDVVAEHALDVVAGRLHLLRP